jgi:FAD synthase
MKFLVEGKDFCCGYKGATDVTQILQFSREHYFDFMAVAPILHEGKKIGSSRVRLAIRQGNFSAVEEMMHHPYQLDCSGFAWKKEGKNLVAHAGDLQVLPENGEYEVEAVLSGCTEKTICTVANGKIQLAGKGGDVSGIIRAITFR